MIPTINYNAMEKSTYDNDKAMKKTTNSYWMIKPDILLKLSLNNYFLS